MKHSRIAKWLSMAVTSLMVALGTQTALAASQTFNFDDITQWAGQGSNQAALVVDWHNDTLDDALVWGFRWDGEATGEDMLRAIAGTAHISTSNGGEITESGSGLDSRLFIQLTSWASFDGDKTLFGMGYDMNGNGFEYVPGANETGHAADAEDIYNEGWMNGFWSYWLDDDGDTEIGNNSALSGSGMSVRTLSNNSVDLWGWDADIDCFFGGGDGIGQPLGPYAAAESTSPVPLPGAVWMMLGGLASVLGLKRKN